MALPKDFSGKREDFNEWYMDLSSYMQVKRHDFHNDAERILFTLNHFHEGAGKEFKQGWKEANLWNIQNIPYRQFCREMIDTFQD